MECIALLNILNEFLGCVCVRRSTYDELDHTVESLIGGTIKNNNGGRVTCAETFRQH